MLSLLILVLTACSSGNDISIEVPSLFVYEMSENQIKSEAKKLDCKSYGIHEDGSVTYIFSESRHQKAVENQVERLKRADSTCAEIYGDLAEFASNSERTRYTLFVENWGADFIRLTAWRHCRIVMKRHFQRLIISRANHRTSLCCRVKTIRPFPSMIMLR